jgi:hypothetical protein
MSEGEPIAPDTKADDKRQRDPETGVYVSKLNDEVQQQIVDALRAGAPPEIACAYAGVVRRTYFNWMALGRTAIENANGNLPEIIAENPHARLVVAVDNALAQFVVGNMTRIGIAGRQKTEGEWQALAWQLERRFPALFSRRTRHEITGRDGGPVQIEHAIVLDPGALDRLPLERKLLLAEILAEMDGEIVDGTPLAIEAGA